VQLHNELGGRGLRILAFPCNQFGKQEQGSADDIRKFVDGYGVKFDMFAKVDVNGKNAHPVFRFVRSHLSDVLGSSIKWNFVSAALIPTCTPPIPRAILGCGMLRRCV
jgi:glutathione peroxidase